jgi:hypothetical protein
MVIEVQTQTIIIGATFEETIRGDAARPTAPTSAALLRCQTIVGRTFVDAQALGVRSDLTGLK